MTTSGVDSALILPAAEVGPAVLGLTEDQWFDRKSGRLAAKDLGPPLIAFANAEGGTLVVGLSGGAVEGMQAHARKINDFRQAPIDFTVPPVRAQFGAVACVNDTGRPDELLVIRIEPGERVHELKNGDCYLRVGDESRRLTYQQRQELEFDKGQAQYDGFPAADVTMADLDQDLVESYVADIGAAGNRERAFRARSLLTRTGRVNNAGYLLFGREPQDLFPQAHVRIVRFLTTERGTGARLGLEDGSDVRVEGPIPRAIQAATDVLDELVPRRRRLMPAGRFEAEPIVPRDAWLEGLVNAVIHRSYSLAGDHIRIEIYPDRIEIESPGRFPGLANPARPLEISRFARNPRIARVCADLRIGQELGEGIRRIFDEMRRVGLTDPVYRQGAGSVRLQLAAIPRLDERLAARLPPGSQKVLDTMRSAGRPLSTGDLSAALELSRPAVLTRLGRLAEADLIRWVGKSKKDPRAVWVLNDGC
jgi:ATP-dependent DNA helicase RecG